MKRLMLIDGFNLVRRIHEAIPSDDSPEKVEGTHKSSIASLRRALKEMQPTHGACVFDFGGKNWRHDIYPRYKESRSPMPVHLKAGMPVLVQLIESMGLKCLTIPDVEADDVIGYLIDKWVASTNGHTPTRSQGKLASTFDVTLRWRDCPKNWLNLKKI